MRLLETSLLIGLVLTTGCASAVYKSGCGHLTGNEVSIPYVGGKATGNVYGCYVAYFGPSKSPDFTPLQKITSDYLLVAGKDNTMKTIDGGTVTYTPPSK